MNTMNKLNTGANLNKITIISKTKKNLQFD